MPRTTLWFVALALVLTAVCWAFAHTTSTDLFGYDEADYVYAGTRGFGANYLDRGSLSFFGYVEKGLALLHDPSQRRSMSQFIRNSGDLDFYRHYHGPLYAYWIATWQGMGAAREAVFRSSGLVLHALGAILIFLLFRRSFPHLPPEAAFLGAAVFAMNRTALVAATIVTQHVVFAFLACCALFAVSEFLRTRRDIFFYLSAALMAASFAAVEIASVLVASVLVCVSLLERERGFKGLLGLFGKGTLWFVATLAIIWPPGVFKLNAIKAYMYLAYMTLGRKVFTPLGPIELWGYKLRVYPLEFVLLLGAMLGGAAWLWRTKSFRPAAPFVFYGVAFFGVTLVITAPYTYYHASLTMALAVVTGVVYGEICNRTSAWVRWVAAAAVLASLIALDVGFYRERLVENAKPSGGTADALAYLNMHPPETRPILIPYLMAPTLHYYRPALATASYDDTSPVESLTGQAAGLGPGTLVFCGPALCRELDPMAASGAERIGTMPYGDEPMFAMRLEQQ